MNTLFQDVADFHKKFGIDYTGKVRELPEDYDTFRQMRLEEEIGELIEAKALLKRGIEVNDPSRIHKGLEKILDGYVDLVYIALGTAYLHGFNFDEAWRRVHEANMAKASARDYPELSRYKNPNDVIKPPGWVAPDLSDLVLHNDHVEKVD